MKMIPPLKEGRVLEATSLIVIFDPGLDKDIDTGGGGEYKYQMSEFRISCCESDRSVMGVYK